MKNFVISYISIFIFCSACSAGFDDFGPLKVKEEVEVVIILSGKTVKGEPKVVSSDNSCYALYKGRQNSFELTKTEKGAWKCNLTKDESYVIGWISSKMFGYLSEPFTASHGVEVEFSPGMPASFEYNFIQTEEDIQTFPAAVSLLKKMTSKGKTNYLNWQESKKIKKPGAVKIKGLASGVYQIKAQPQNRDYKTPFLYDCREVTIKPGTVNRFNIVYPEIDKTVEDGDVVIEGTVYSADLKPVLNKKVKLEVLNDQGLRFDLYYLPTVTDANGHYRFEGVRPNLGLQINCGQAHGLLTKKSTSENAYITVDLNTASKKFVASVGSQMPEILVRWNDDKVNNLNELKGKILVIDFWATWCNPCRKALPKFDSLAGNENWKEDVVFIALSIDSDYDIWKKTVEKANWKQLRHGWFDRKKNSTALNRPIPYTMIIDSNGTICSSGNGIDIEHELNKLIEKKIISKK